MTSAATAAVTMPVVRALLDEARRKNYHHGVLGIRARPEWNGAETFLHEQVPVRVLPCVSALAVREALLHRGGDDWLVLLTDREDLGTGVLSHLLWHRLRTADPWDAVRHRFAATGLDPALTNSQGQREIAIGLLSATPAAGWSPARGGVLTRDHALGALAGAWLHLGDPDVDAAALLSWTTDPAAAGRVAELRRVAGNPLTGAVLDWAADRAGAAATPLRHLLRSGEGADAVPLGVVLAVLIDAGDRSDGADRQLAREALIRLEPRVGGMIASIEAMRSWAAEAAELTASLLLDAAGRPVAEKVLARADEILRVAQAASLADRSDLLPSGLTRRLARLADALRAASDSSAALTGADRDVSQISVAAVADVEPAWFGVTTHRLADTDRRTPAFWAAVRLLRWLSLPVAPATAGLPDLVARHSDVDAWVDSAINDASPGVGEPDLGAGLAAVLTAVRGRRDAHDLAFAAVLARYTSGEPDSAADLGSWQLENLLPAAVLPLASKTPVLLLVLDGMSVGVATEVVGDVLARATDGWVEALLPGHTRRAAALAVLPTLTEVSRASLLCGELRVGGQDVEQRGYAALTRAHGLPGAKLFHKKPLDSSRPGFAVADDVGAAIDDLSGVPLVTCVLNTIDDALDRSDPGGTDWRADTVKHLTPLLDRARYAGRTIVLTADHGHIVERRQGVQHPHASISSSRSRAAGEPAGDGEVLVAGRRVLCHEGRAVLAVNERLRYGPLKAGYHGGAAPAEVVVPVVVLVLGAVPEDVDLRLAPPQEPLWWNAPLVAPTAATRATDDAELPRAAVAHPTLFDSLPGHLDDLARTRRAGTKPGSDQGNALADAVLGSTTYAAQQKVAGRVSVTDAQVGSLLTALHLAPGQRLAPAPAATALAVSPLGLRGAILHLQRLLNVEGYAVLRVDADGVTVVLDEALLREQFGVPG